jgi:hypothetical protein
MSSVAAPEGIDDQDFPRWQRELDKPLSGGLCLVSWIAATALFFGLVTLFGGLTSNDAVESLYPTWAIAHGSFACSYPPASSATSAFALLYQPGPTVPPLWPLISGGLSALVGIGHAVPFPTQHVVGPGCVNGYEAINRWSLASRALSPTLNIGYASWVVLLAGFIGLLRAAGRGRTRWEALGALLLAVVPVVWMPLLFEYHPQDLVVIGLGLGGAACALRGKWWWAGLLVGLAMTSQQLGLLVLVPLAIVAPGRNRWRLLLAWAGAIALVSVPFLIATSGRAFHAIVTGTGDSETHGGTVLWNLFSHPNPFVSTPTGPLVLITRAGPIVVGVALAWWAVRRLGPLVLEPIPLVSLVATCLSMRLVFEVDLFGYYFLALAVMLVALDIIRGRLRGQVVAWLALVTMAFNPIHLNDTTPEWRYHAATAIPLTCMAVVLVVIVRNALHHKVRWYLVAWFVVAAYAFLRWPVWLPNGLPAARPLWVWQLVLVIPAVVMAASPLFGSMRTHNRSTSAAAVAV